ETSHTGLTSDRKVRLAVASGGRVLPRRAQAVRGDAVGAEQGRDRLLVRQRQGDQEILHLELGRALRGGFLLRPDDDLLGGPGVGEPRARGRRWWAAGTGHVRERPGE